MNDWVAMLWIPGQPPRKSNSRRIVRNHRTGHPMLIKSAEARSWAAQAIAGMSPQLRQLQLGSAERPLRIEFECVYESRRPDLSVELILDVLERAGVISNDRWVYQYTARKRFDKEHPGVRIGIAYLEEEHA